MLHRVESSKFCIYRTPHTHGGPATGASRPDGTTEPAVWHDEMHIRLRGLHDSIDVIHSVRRLSASARAWIVDGNVVGPGDKHHLLRLTIVGRQLVVGKGP